MKILVSACLLGENCKYSGGNNYNQAVCDFARSVFQILNLLPILPRFWALKKRILLFLSPYREVRRNLF